MNRWMFLLLSALLLSACISPLPAWGEGLGVRATATPTLTPTPTRTLTPTLTPTPTVTPTPVLPPEALTRLEGRGWRIEGDKIMVGDVAWYTRDAEGRWQPAQFIVDFDQYGFSLEGLEAVTGDDGRVRLVGAPGQFWSPPFALVENTEEPGNYFREEIEAPDPDMRQTAYEVDKEGIGRFDLYFVVWNLPPERLMPTPYPPILLPNIYHYPKYNFDALLPYLKSLSPRVRTTFKEIYGLELKYDNAENPLAEYEMQSLVLNPDLQAYGQILFTNARSWEWDDYTDDNQIHPNEILYLAFEDREGKIHIIPLINNISNEGVLDFWESIWDKWQVIKGQGSR